MFIIDFDDTLFDTYHWKQARFSSLEPLGISSSDVANTYSQAKHVSTGRYSDDVHAEILSKSEFPKEDIKKLFQTIAEPKILKQYLFDDAIQFLSALQKIGHPIVLLTHGDPLFQSKKIEAVDIEKYFDEVVYVKGDKKEVVGDLIDKYASSTPIWFINDKIEETKQVVKLFPHIHPIMKQSQQFEKTAYEYCGFPFFESLTDIVSYVQTSTV